MSPVIDAHFHLWQVGRHGFEWPTPDLTAIYRDFAASDLRAAAGAALQGAVAVQSQPSDADTQWLLSLAETDPLILGVVGWTDLSAPDAAARVAELARHPRLKGLRPMLQGLSDDNWIVRPDVAPALSAMQAAGLVFDALVFTRHLSSIEAVAQRYPDLRIVIDHGAKPPIATTPTQSEATRDWTEAMTAIARHPNVVCKLSGLFTEMRTDQPFDEAAPYVAHLLTVFGPQRLLFGSDWPVVRLNGDWQKWKHWLEDQLNPLTPPERQAIFFTNAKRIYDLQGVP
jgi:L-fuconolactonase